MRSKLTVLFCVAAMAAVVAVVLANSASAANTTLLGGTLSMTALKYSPYPAEPGQYIDLWISVSNSAAASENVECALEPAFPFSLDANENASRQIGELLIGQSTVLKYKVRVDPKAVFGANEMVFKCRSLAADWVAAKFSVTVQPQDVVVSISRIEVNPFEVEPGQEAVVKVYLKNQATSSVRDVSVKIDLSSTALPFAFVKSAGEQRLQFLDAGEEKTVQFDVMASPDAAAKLYKTTLALSYTDESGKQYSGTYDLGLVVAAKPELLVDLETSNILRGGDAGSAVIKIANKGLSDVKFLNARLQSGAGYEVLSSNDVYVGALDSDDYQTIEYKIYAEKTASGQLTLPLALSYRDANNKAYEETRNVALRLYSDEEITRMGLQQQGGTNMVVVAVFALVLLYVAWRIYKRWTRKKPRA